MAKPVDVPACFAALPWFAGGPSSARALARAAAEGAGAEVRDLRTAVAAADLLMWPFVLEHGALPCKLAELPVACGSICRLKDCWHWEGMLHELISEWRTFSTMHRLLLLIVQGYNLLWAGTLHEFVTQRRTCLASHRSGLIFTGLTFRRWAGTLHELVGQWRAFLTALAAPLSSRGAAKRDPQLCAAIAHITELKTRCC